MSLISQHYVITASVAVFGALPLEILAPTMRTQIITCNAFLSRATYHGAELHVPMAFYLDVTRFAFRLYQRDLIRFEDCKILTRDVLNAIWEYHFPATDDIHEVSREFPKLPLVEYLALARDKNYSLIYTDPTYGTSIKQDGVLVAKHPWAAEGSLDEFPPST
jgi:hypothetical protein